MGMHIGLVAVRGSVSEFMNAFAEVWPKFEIVATKDGFANEDEIWAWKGANERCVVLRERIFSFQEPIYACARWLRKPARSKGTD